MLQTGRRTEVNQIWTKTIINVVQLHVLEEDGLIKF